MAPSQMIAGPGSRKQHDLQGGLGISLSELDPEFIDFVGDFPGRKRMGFWRSFFRGMLC